MPAVARPKPAPRSRNPQAQAQAHPQAKTQPKSAPKVQASKRGRTPPRAPVAPYTPAKLEAARGVGLAPKLALGVASAAVLAVVGVALFTGDRLETLERGLDRTTGALVAATGFGVDAIEVKGASKHTEAAVLAAAGVEPGDNILGVDLQAVRGRVDQVGWVEDVTVRRLLPDTLAISVKERRPMAVWQYKGRIGLVDATGKVIASADATQFPQLPLVVGAGAGQAAGEILPLLHARPRLMERVEALVRVDRRRWDVRLRDGALIQLPALDEADALMRLDKLEASARVLELGFEKIDLRDPELVAVRPRADQPRPIQPEPIAAVVTNAATAPAAAPPSAAPAASGL
ncbi:MAG: FtsQ-type POTRA domain-containing protein [Proteobacteria bacterium]|nr:FtsQ-type POTRA domain-containing protein [Pseudomonadota bacterium]